MAFMCLSKYGVQTLEAYSRTGRTYVINACLSICRFNAGWFDQNRRWLLGPTRDHEYSFKYQQCKRDLTLIIDKICLKLLTETS